MSTVPSANHPFDVNLHQNALQTEIADSTEQNWVPMCRFFLNGNCRYGDFCRNSHVRAEDTATDVIVTDQNDSNNNHDSSYTTDTNSGARNWIDAPEFVPRYISQKTYDTNQVNDEDQGASSQCATFSYAQIVTGNTQDNGATEIFHSDTHNLPTEYLTSMLCPYIQSTITRADGKISCKYGDRCQYQHGDLCEICGLYCLHPTDENQRKKHEKECMSIMEKDMEHSFAVQRSRDKTCGICFEVITEKTHRGEHRFGILPNCNHIFCLPCIRKWRQAKNFDSTITRACPECRVESHFVCPSLYWVDTKEEKDKLLGEYKEALRHQNCKYFNKGEGTCPFGNKCFYKHALPNGELVDVGVPQQRRRFDINGDTDVFEQVFLWDFLRARDNYSDDDDTISSFTDPSDLD